MSCMYNFRRWISFCLECSLYINHRQIFILPYYWKRAGMFKFIDLLNSSNVCLLQKLGSFINHVFKIRSDALYIRHWPILYILSFHYISAVMYYNYVYFFCYLQFVYVNIVKLPHRCILVFIYSINYLVQSSVCVFQTFDMYTIQLFLSKLGDHCAAKRHDRTIHLWIYNLFNSRQYRTVRSNYRNKW